MSVGSFLKNIWRFNPAGYVASVGQGLFKGGKAVFNYLNNNGHLSSLLNSVTGAHLTGAQREANAFVAQQAQNQMDFQERMSNTEYQRGVADMKAAGVNPALMYGSGANGASTPSGAMASSVSPGSPDVVGFITALANLSMLKAQRDNIKADTDKKRADIDLTKQNIVESVARIQQIKANVRSLGLSADAQEIVNKYLDRKESVSLQNLSLEGDKLAAEWTEIQQKISNLSTEQQKILQDIAESSERVNYLLSREALNDAQVEELHTAINKMNAERDHLVKSGKLLDKDIDFYEWNHGSEVSGFGLKPGTRYIPSESKRNRNR